MLLGQNGKWPWARRGSRQVPVKDHKLGFNSVLAICADGSVSNFVMHWASFTGVFSGLVVEKKPLATAAERCHGTVPIPDPLIDQIHGHS